MTSYPPTLTYPSSTLRRVGMGWLPFTPTTPIGGRGEGNPRSLKLEFSNNYPPSTSMGIEHHHQLDD